MNSIRHDERHTAADDVFESLRADIVSLRIEPGAKLSEVEIAKQRDVSRQPVREAFIRLSNVNLLQIRPQRATIVRKISRSDLLNSRFVRTAVEIEVVQRACKVFDQRKIGFKRNLTQQLRAAVKGDTSRFHLLDYEFHRLLCVAANCEFAFQTIAENKSHVDRLCMITLADRDTMESLQKDHIAIFECLEAGDSDGIVKLTRNHLSRLDQELAAACSKRPEYFED